MARQKNTKMLKNAFLGSVVVLVSGCCWRPTIYSTKSIVELERGKLESEKNINRNVSGNMYYNSISYAGFGDLYGDKIYFKKKGNCDAEYIDNLITDRIINDGLNSDTIVTKAKNEGMDCNKESCERNFCTWITGFSIYGGVKRMTPEYCMNVVLNYKKCESDQNVCVEIKSFHEENYGAY